VVARERGVSTARCARMADDSVWPRSDYPLRPLRLDPNARLEERIDALSPSRSRDTADNEDVASSERPRAVSQTVLVPGWKRLRRGRSSD
jgi:hypothetical protein